MSLLKIQLDNIEVTVDCTFDKSKRELSNIGLFMCGGNVTNQLIDRMEEIRCLIWDRIDVMSADVDKEL